MAKTFHFQLVEGYTDQELTTWVGTEKVAVKAHTPHTLRNAVSGNRALTLLPGTSQSLFTHYAEIPEKLLPTNHLTRIRVTSPDPDPDIYLPALHHVSIHIPERHRRRYYERKMARSGMYHHPKLSALGLAKLSNTLSTSELIQACVDAELLQTPLDIAISILFSNPELASNRPHTAAIVTHDHIYPSEIINPQQYNRVRQLATIISKQGQATSTGGWATITDSVDKDGNPLYFEFDLDDRKTGDRVLEYKWSEMTTDEATAPNGGAMQTASNDTSLQNQTWSVNQGKTASEHQDNSGSGSVTVRRAYAAAVETAAPQFKWTVKELTPNHGLGVDAGSLKFHADGTFSIKVKNTYLRSLGAFAQFFNEKGETIKNPAGWEEKLPEFMRSWFETDYKKFITPVSAVNSVMGIPMPTDPKTLSFQFPSDATSLKLLFGGLGTSQWDKDVALVGSLMTGIMQYGIPTIFLVAGAAVKSSKWYNEFVEDWDNIVAVLGVAFPIVGGGVATASAFDQTKWALSTVANAVAGMLVQKGLEKLALKIAGEITVAALATNIPFAGWALRAANMAINIAAMAVTTGEILSSPSTLSATVARSMDLEFTLKPDPEHGEAGHPETAVWPAVSHHYQVTVQYEGGTNFVLKGRMPETTSSTPLKLTFADIPVGGKLQIMSGIYSESGWLCGKYQGEWLPAFPDDGSTSLQISGNITEILVPLTQDTQYNYKEKIVYDAPSQKHVWHAGDLPTATVASLDCSSGGNRLCKPVGMTLNGQAYQVGYVWSASSQNYLAQNLSVLADPQSRFKLSETAFPVQPAIAYDQFGVEPKEGQEREVSLNNFIVDTRNNQFHLRRVDLMDNKPGFGLNDSNLKSWGKFNLSNIDGVVVHPDGAVIAVSWRDSKMEILQIPEAPSDDNKAEDAQMVSGLGVRQGLLNGPRALAVTPDGRVLILETVNQRIQSFDTKGNPVASFLGEKLFTLPASGYAADLDKGQFSAALQQQFQANGLTHIFDLAGSLASDLNSGVLTDYLIDAFADEGVYLAYDKEHMNDHNISAFVTIVVQGQQWKITDPTRSAVYDIQKAGNVLNVNHALTDVTIDVRAEGSTWVLEDSAGAKSYYIAKDETNNKQLNVNRYLPHMKLYNPDGRTDITYLDVAVEAKGYIYVLSYVSSGSVVSNYSMDIYNPDGSFLVRTPNSRLQPANPQYISAAKFVIDVWRSVYTLNYEAIVGANNRTEPSISHWTPTPPLFDLPLEKQPDFDNHNVNAIRADFAANGITLSTSTRIETVNESGFWYVIDGSKTYDVIRSGSSLQVYGIPAS